MNVPPQGGRKHPDQKFIEIDTRNILFVAGGAFDGIQRHIARRLNTKSVGYQSSKERESVSGQSMLRFVSPQDLKSFGLIPELIGRLPVLTYLEPLDAASLKSILTDPKNALIKQYQRLFEMDNIELTFKEEALDLIVEKALEFKLGARGLRSICEAVLNDAMFHMPSDERTERLVISRSYAEEKLDQSVMKRLKAVG